MLQDQNPRHGVQGKMENTRICSVCNTPVEKNYCGQCGQRAIGKNATIASLVTDSLSNLFYLEKSVFGTILKIIQNPKAIVLNYYAGFRNYYSSPGKLLLYAVATIALHITFINSNVLGMVINIKNVSTQYFFWIMHLPIVLLISYLAFVRQIESIAKHIISVIYISSAWFILFTIIDDLIILSIGDILGNLAFIVFVLVTFIWNSRVFSKERKPIRVILNTFLQLGIYIIIVLILVLASNGVRLK